ncbi:MAG: hypothetical protein CV045_02990 [Cyanobacteria bacterium M5B4]|nr:MAG: hypothetical protein CV045_02990 [Cyanobacteria bacterium M5B4]
MPEPFSLFAPLPPVKEKVVLINSFDLLLALPSNLVQEALLGITIDRIGRFHYQDKEIPVILGQRACPPSSNVSLVIMKTTELTTGFLGIAGMEVPQLAAIGAGEWRQCRQLPYPWLSEGKGFVKGRKLFSAVTGIKF